MAALEEEPSQNAINLIFNDNDYEQDVLQLPAGVTEQEILQQLRAQASLEKKSRPSAHDSAHDVTRSAYTRTKGLSRSTSFKSIVSKSGNVDPSSNDPPAVKRQALSRAPSMRWTHKMSSDYSAANHMVHNPIPQRPSLQPRPSDDGKKRRRSTILGSWRFRRDSARNTSIVQPLETAYEKPPTPPPKDSPPVSGPSPPVSSRGVSSLDSKVAPDFVWSELLIIAQKDPAFQELSRQAEEERGRFATYEMKQRKMLAEHYEKARSVADGPLKERIAAQEQTHADAQEALEDKHLEQELELQHNQATERRTVQGILEHMENYCTNSEVRSISDDDRGRLKTQIAKRDALDLKHCSAVNVLRHKQELALRSLQQKQAQEVLSLQRSLEDELTQIDWEEQQTRAKLDVLITSRQQRLSERWQLRVTLWRKGIEGNHGVGSESPGMFREVEWADNAASVPLPDTADQELQNDLEEKRKLRIPTPENYTFPSSSLQELLVTSSLG